MNISFLQASIIVVLSLLPLFLIIWLFYINISRRHARKAERTVIPWYEPPDNLSPIVLSKMLVDSLSAQEIVAEILYCKIRGYITFENGEEGGGILIKRGIVPPVSPFEKNLMDVLFAKQETVSASTLFAPGDAQDTINGLFLDFVNSDIYPTYYTASSVRLVKWSAAIGLCCFVLAFGGFIFPPLLACIPLAFIFLLSANSFLRKNEAGKRLYEQTLGFKQYLKIAEIERMKYTTDPAHPTASLDKLLPYAIALGLEDRWVSVFQTQDPALYELWRMRKV